MMLFFKILTDFVCGILFSWGGYDFLPARRFIMPTVLAIMVSCSTHVWWNGFMVLPVIGTLCLGYFKIKNQFFARGLWLALQALVIGLGLTITGHLAWFIYAPYVLTAGLLAGLLYNEQQIIGDGIFGVALGSVLFFIR